MCRWRVKLLVNVLGVNVNGVNVNVDCSQAALESAAAELSSLEEARIAQRQAGPLCGGQGACAQLSPPLRAFPDSLDLGLVTLKRVTEIRRFGD